VSQARSITFSRDGARVPRAMFQSFQKERPGPAGHERSGSMILRSIQYPENTSLSPVFHATVICIKQSPPIDFWGDI
jgi:hypothetical protein